MYLKIHLDLNPALLTLYIWQRLVNPRPPIAIRAREGTYFLFILWSSKQNYFFFHHRKKWAKKRLSRGGGYPDLSGSATKNITYFFMCLP